MDSVPTYADLAAMSNAQERGYAFERYVAELLRQEQFAVSQRPKAASRRQVDLFASRGSEHYLIETKWRKSAVGLTEVDDLVQRLRRGTPNVIGVLISANGFAQSAVERVEEDATRPVLLVSGTELLHVERSATFHRLLRAKHERLIVHRQAAVAIDASRGAGTEGPLASRGQYAFVGDDGQRQSMVELAGDFGRVAFCLELPDLDRSDGFGVGIDIPLAGSDTPGLTRIFHRLGERGWITPAGTWRIQQQGATWNGFGLDSLLEALSNPAPRYAGRRMHHSETLTYADTAGGGLYSVTATIARSGIDRVSMSTLSFRLPGIPLDPGPLRTLVHSLDIDVEPYFRSLGAPVTSRVRLPSVLRSQPVQADALIVGNPAMAVINDDDTDGKDEWVLGAVIKNPFVHWRTRLSRLRQLNLDAQTLEGLARDNDFLVCSLGSWHYLSERRDYFIDFVETVQVGDSLLTRVRLDWYEQHQPSGRTPRSALAVLNRPQVGPNLVDRLSSKLVDVSSRTLGRISGRGLWCILR